MNEQKQTNRMLGQKRRYRVKLTGTDGSVLEYSSANECGRKFLSQGALVLRAEKFGHKFFGYKVEILRS